MSYSRRKDVGTPRGRGTRRSQLSHGRGSSPGSSSGYESGTGGLSHHIGGIHIGGPSSGSDGDGQLEHRPTGDVVLSVSELGGFYPHADPADYIWELFKIVPNPTGYSWKLTPEDVRQRYWEEFKKKFTWELALDARIRELWYDKIRERYKDYICGIKRRRNDPPPRGGKPGWWTDDVWMGWLAYWSRDDVVTKSQAVRRNRLSEPQGPGTGPIKHRGGSKSVMQRAEEKGRERGVAPISCMFDSFLDEHRYADRTYTDPKFEAIATEVFCRADEERAQLPEGDHDAVDINELYLEVLGGPDKKKRMFGTGGAAKALKASRFGGSSSTSRQSRDEVEELRRRVEEQDRERREYLAEQQRLAQQMAVMQSQQAEMMRWMQSQQGGAPFFPSYQPPPSDPPPQFPPDDDYDS